MQSAEADEFGMREPRNGAENALLWTVFQFGLETDHIVERAELVVLAKLHDGVGFCQRIMRVGEPYRLHWPVTQRLAAALGHDLDRQAAVEIGGVGFPFLEVGLLTRDQGVHESIVLLLGQRTIDVVGARATRAKLVVARLKPRHRHVDRILVDDRGNRIEFGERVSAMRFRHSGGAHFVQDHMHACIGELPGGLRTGEAGADNMHGVGSCLDTCHGETGSAFSAAVECAEVKNDNARTRRALSVRHVG